MKTFQDLLRELDACKEAIKWAGDRTIEQIVVDCHRGDWLLWLAKKIEINNRKLTLAKAHCANTVRFLMKDERSTKAIDVAILYGENKLSDAALKNAASAAASAASASEAGYAAYADYNAAAAASAAYAAPYADHDASATASAAYAAAYAAAYTAYADYNASAAASAAYAAAAASSASEAGYAASAAASAASASYYSAKKQNQMQTADICRKYIGKSIIKRVNKLLNK